MHYSFSSPYYIASLRDFSANAYFLFYQYLIPNGIELLIGKFTALIDNGMIGIGMVKPFRISPNRIELLISKFTALIDNGMKGNGMVKPFRISPNRIELLISKFTALIDNGMIGIGMVKPFYLVIHSSFNSKY
jgi:hypothetical protein